ncbi:ABC transporter substrate-binding protein [Mycetocola lacteus]|uniref:ABC transporter substrate-binding protein n=1 Tax=Mycetocola lacteus TaxID=76637 RepID=A0A3L7AH37_9MICO|nr:MULTISPECIES: ABC transporter substrate-binding protein [Mycetocola]RLP79793.1 ABC transporter substrate-binding protein [Mycetocola lacteus]
MKKFPRRSRLLSLVAITIATGLALTGCNIHIESKPDPTIPQDTLLLAADQGSPMYQRNFNPFMANRRIGAAYIYEPLVIVNDVNGDVTPWLAQKVTQPDASTVVFTLRDGVKWSDGKPLTAKDVEFTFNLLKTSPTLDMQGIWQYISTVETGTDEGSQTVTVHLKSADVPAANIIAQTLILPEHLWKNVKDPGTYTDENPVGTGPFTLGNYSPQQYTMNRNENYWQKDKVTVKHLILPATNGQLAMVTQGYDWGYMYMSDVKKTWGGANQYNRYWFPPGGVISLQPNLTKAPFNNPDVRQGIALALDRKQIADAATEGSMQPATQAGILLPNQQADLDPSIPNGGVITQDLDAAKAAFARAGYHDQDGKLVDASGKQLSFSLLTANGYTDWLRAASQVQRQLSALGIDVKLTQPQPPAYQLALRNGDFDIAMGAYGGLGSQYQDLNGLLNSSNFRPVGQEAPSNFERYQNPAVDEILAKYRTSLDPNETRELGYQLQHAMVTDLPVISLYYGGSWGLYSENKYVGWPDADHPYASLKTYTPTALLIFTSLKPREHTEDKK